MFYSKERQELISDEQKNKERKARAITRGDVEGVTTGFNSGKQFITADELLPHDYDSGDEAKRIEILFRKF